MSDDGSGGDGGKGGGDVESNGGDVEVGKWKGWWF